MLDCWRRWGRGLGVAMLALPLLGAGPCVQIAQNAVIKGFFNAVTELLIERAETRLTATQTAGTETGRYAGLVAPACAGADQVCIFGDLALSPSRHPTRLERYPAG